MPFLSQEPCVGHAGSSTDPSASCCSGYTKWFYDANTGQPYTGFMCWTAPCADQGQFAKPAGVSGPGCCPPLVNVGGKCSVAPTSGGGGSSSGGSGGSSSGSSGSTAVCAGSIICSVPDMYIYGAAGLLLLLVMSGGKKR